MHQIPAWYIMRPGIYAEYPRLVFSPFDAILIILPFLINFMNFFIVHSEVVLLIGILNTPLYSILL